MCPQKESPNCTRVTIGGNQIYHPGDTGTNTSSLELFKLVLNRVLFQKGAKFSSFNVKKIALAPRLTTQSTSKSNLPTSPNNFPMNMTSPSTPATDGYILTFVRVCMAYPNRSESPTNNSTSVFKKQVTTRRPQPLVSGATSGDP